MGDYIPYRAIRESGILNLLLVHLSSILTAQKYRKNTNFLQLTKSQHTHLLVSFAEKQKIKNEKKSFFSE